METAVEWFYETIINDPLGDWKYYFEQAKEMEKQQIIDAYYGEAKSTEILDAEEYYNKAFKK